MSGNFPVCPFCSNEMLNSSMFKTWDGKHVSVFVCPDCQVEIQVFDDSEKDLIDRSNKLLSVRHEKTCTIREVKCFDGGFNLFCSNCGGELYEAENYCTYCGAKIMSDTNEAQ